MDFLCTYLVFLLKPMRTTESNNVLRMLEFGLVGIEIQ